MLQSLKQILQLFVWILMETPLEAQAQTRCQTTACGSKHRYMAFWVLLSANMEIV